MTPFLPILSFFHELSLQLFHGQSDIVFWTDGPLEKCWIWCLNGTERIVHVELWYSISHTLLWCKDFPCIHSWREKKKNNKKKKKPLICTWKIGDPIRAVASLSLPVGQDKNISSTIPYSPYFISYCFSPLFSLHIFFKSICTTCWWNLRKSYGSNYTKLWAFWKKKFKMFKWSN